MSNLESVYTLKDFEQHPMNQSFSVRQYQSNSVWLTPKLSSFLGVNFCRITIFLSYLDNKHIKWNLKSFGISICCQKVQFCIKFLNEKGFKINMLHFPKKKKLKPKFQKIFSCLTKFWNILEWFLRTKAKFTWRMNNHYFIIDKV